MLTNWGGGVVAETQTPLSGVVASLRFDVASQLCRISTIYVRELSHLCAPGNVLGTCWECAGILRQLSHLCDNAFWDCEKIIEVRKNAF